MSCRCTHIRRTPRFGLCHVRVLTPKNTKVGCVMSMDILTSARTPRFGLCHVRVLTQKNTKVGCVMSMYSHQKNTKVRAVSRQGTDTKKHQGGLCHVNGYTHISKNTKVRAVSRQGTDTKEHQGGLCHVNVLTSEEHQGSGCVTSGY